MRPARLSGRIGLWLETVDPGTHRRIKGLRLVTAYGIAAMMGALPDIASGLAGGVALSSLAGGFALWASVSEGRTNRADSTRDLAILCAAAGVGALMMIALAPLLGGPGHPGAELTLASGAFLVGYLKRFGVLGAGIGSQIYIGQLLAYGADLSSENMPMVGLAVVIAAVAAIVPWVLSGPAEHPAEPIPTPPPLPAPLHAAPELIMGLQAALAALIIVALDRMVGLEEAAWAITACTYVIGNSTARTMERVRRRIVGTMIGVPLGIACLPLASEAPLVLWCLAALAMVIYAMALPERYDIACGAFAFTLIVTLAITGEHSPLLFLSRIWETLIGGALGLAAAVLLLPLRAREPPA